MAESAAYIVDVTESNINDVLQNSMQKPVLLDFWAAWCGPCKAMSPILNKIADEYRGKFILAKIDADASPALSQQLGVRSLPTLKLVVQGQLVDELMGAQPEAAIRQMLEPHIGVADAPDEDPFMAQIARARQMGAYDQAIDALQSAIGEQPENWEYYSALVDVLIDAERLEDARQVADNIKDDKTKKAATVRLSFLEWLEGAPDAQTVQARLKENPDDVEARYYFGLHLLMAGYYAEGLELLLDVMKADRSFKEDGAKEALLKAFDMIGGDPAVSKIRRRMFALLH